ncbi:MAG: radical SAM family heme chaperone HemW [Desulfobacterales bacterium]
MTMLEENGGLYIHVPFCVRKCRYCDFYSETDLAPIDAFVDAVVRETAMIEKPLMKFDSLYLGGGTPSLLFPDHVQTLIEAIRNAFELVPGSEITLEANPKTTSAVQLTRYRAAGINRIHLGVQSFNDRRLAFLGRMHTSADAESTLQQARNAGFENLGIDLIYGLPGQTLSDWFSDLRRAVYFRPEHLSCYMLTLEPGTPLFEDAAAGKFTSLSDAKTRDLYMATVAFLEEHGYDQYEISNFASRPSPAVTEAGGHTFDPENPCKSHHNRKYWSGAPYLGFGPSAHSHVARQRWWNARSLTGYLKSILNGHLPIEEREVLSREQVIIESVYLGLRTVRGIDVAAFETHYGVNFTRTFEPVLGPLVNAGLMECLPDRCRLTRRGMLYLDTIADRMITVL